MQKLTEMLLKNISVLKRISGVTLKCGCWGYMDESPPAGVLTLKVPLGYTRMKRSQQMKDASTEANTQRGLVSLSSAGAIVFIPLGLQEAAGINFFSFLLLA